MVPTSHKTQLPGNNVTISTHIMFSCRKTAEFFDDDKNHYLLLSRNEANPNSRWVFYLCVISTWRFMMLDC